MRTRPASAIASTSNDPPPTYTDDLPSPVAQPAASSSLTAFSNANRVLISPDLEARLIAAGYLSTDDPDTLTEEEWRDDYGATKLELLRLRTLYARSVAYSSGHRLGSVLLGIPLIHWIQ
jgi:hypothetical protein